MKSFCVIVQPQFGDPSKTLTQFNTYFWVQRLSLKFEGTPPRFTELADVIMDWLVEQEARAVDFTRSQ